jgi:hypothetical protein
METDRIRLERQLATVAVRGAIGEIGYFGTAQGVAGEAVRDPCEKRAWAGH